MLVSKKILYLIYQSNKKNQMIKQLQKFGKDISPHYMWYWEWMEIIIPFAIKKVAEECMRRLSDEYDGLCFELKESPNGWDIFVSEPKCKHEHLIDVEKVPGERYGPKCKDCGEFVKC